MKLHREMSVTQKTAWHLAHRIRRALGKQPKALFQGPVEVDETYVGGRRRNMKKSKREQLTGRGPAGKVAVVGAKDRTTNKISAQVVEDTTSETLQGFVMGNVVPGTKLHRRRHRLHLSLPNHESVKHSVETCVGKFTQMASRVSGLR